MKIIFLHGLGQDASSFSEVQKNLKNFKTESNRLPIEMSFHQLRKYLLHQLSFQKEAFVLVGLSLGGVLALSLAEELPLCRGLVLSGSQYKLKGNLLFKLQIAFMKLLPKSFYDKHEVDKEQMIALQKSMVDLDLTNQAKSISLPTMIICGSKDKHNLTAAKELVDLISNSKYEIIQDGGHELNIEKPREFAEVLRQFVGSNFS